MSVPPAPAPDPRRWWALALLCTAGFMVVVDGAIVFVALPSIAADLHLRAGGLQWVFTAYLVTFGGLLLLGGRAADLLGRRRVFLAGVALFTVSSLACGFAGSGAALIAARAVQGVAAAVMTPAGQSILVTTFAEGPEQNRALGIWSTVGGFGAAAGALIGGPVTQAFGWRWIFFINVPIGALVLLLSPALLGESREAKPGTGFDTAGAVTLVGSLVLLIFAVVGAPEAGWASGRTLGLLSASVALLAMFVDVEHRAAAPLVPFRLFRSRPLVGGNLLIFSLGMGAAGLGLILTRYGQGVLGYSPARYALLDALFSVLTIVGSVAGQAAVTRYGVRAVGTAAAALAAAGCLVLAQVSTRHSSLWYVLVGMVVIGGGLGAGFVAASIAALTGIRDADAGLASGVNNAAFQFGGAVGIAVLATVAVAATRSGDPVRALTEGSRAAFLATMVLSAGGLVAALALLGAPVRTRLEVRVTGAGCRTVPLPVPR